MKFLKIGFDNSSGKPVIVNDKYSFTNDEFISIIINLYNGAYGDVLLDTLSEKDRNNLSKQIKLHQIQNICDHKINNLVKYLEPIVDNK